ncbi:YkgJ family cysteine cluster protein [Geoglobus sp.]
MEVKLRCSEISCCECCRDTEMQLSERDLRRIEKLGFSRDEFSVEVDGIRVLKNVDGSCYFLKDCSCSIYPNRPLGCRLYPVVYDVELRKATVHDFCPLADEIPKSKIKKVERILFRHISDIYGFLP